MSRLLIKRPVRTYPRVCKLSGQACDSWTQALTGGRSVPLDFYLKQLPEDQRLALAVDQLARDRVPENMVRFGFASRRGLDAFRLALAVLPADVSAPALELFDLIERPLPADKKQAQAALDQLRQAHIGLIETLFAGAEAWLAASA